METITFNRDKAKRLQRVYNNAVKDKLETFEFEGHEFLVSYAGYVLEYLRRKFGGF